MGCICLLSFPIRNLKICTTHFQSFFNVILQMSTYNDLVGKNVFVRVHDVEYPEWQKSKVLKLVESGLKVECLRNGEQFIIERNSVCDDIRLLNAFRPYEREQKPYDGNLCLACC